ncbi:efflux RND transporter periplasmic adaptor subunit [Geopsychrobacter electrodiphilus]|uniref:efflux RND transporter periplasmic adaptor subunit n=1 Tax=Geopsychrobacter electrodiphilus TaxID=225196 RepID=UPI000374D9AA|nr:efflux RND transporter periplasmic adaptor subunit [Geopsychrobacter electrodiphilus]
MNILNHSKQFVIVGLLLAGFSLSACSEQSTAAPSPKAHPSPEVGVVVMEFQQLPITTELSGRVSPYLIAEVRPQVGGILQKRLFKEGAEVKAGEVLYRIDPATYAAAYASSEAALAKAEANLDPARLKEARYAELVRINAVSKQDYDDAAAALKQAEAEVQVAKAARDTARINLDYTTIKAPISGRIGRSLVTTGALVTASQTTPLATIQQLNQVYVDVAQSSADLLRLKRELASGVLKGTLAGQAKVHLVLEDGTSYDQQGTFKFSDVTVNPSTGSVTLRSVFPNPGEVLLPGMYVQATIEEGLMKQALLVPQRGVTRNPAGNALVMVVGAGEKIEPREIQVARTVGDNWLVTGGLKPGDRVIVEGLQHARPGTVINAVPFTPAAAAK